MENIREHIYYDTPFIQPPTPADLEHYRQMSAYYGLQIFLKLNFMLKNLRNLSEDGK